MIDNLSYVIGNALLGWLGVFIVTIILILLVYLFNYLFSNKSLSAGAASPSRVGAAPPFFCLCGRVRAQIFVDKTPSER